MVRAGAALLALVLVVVGAAGCGEEEGVANGGVVKVYVEAPLCDGDVAAIIPNKSGDAVAAKHICLPAALGPGLSQGVGGGRQIDLATAGANARRASEDSATIAYIAPDEPAVGRFVHPILEAASIGWITAGSGKAATKRLSEVVFEADMNSLRADIREQLGQ